MRIAVRPEWSFMEAVDAAWDAYRGGREHGVPNRIRVLEQWANVVGRERAQTELETTLKTYSDISAASVDLGFSIYALKKLRRSFSQMPLITPHSQVAKVEAPMLKNYDFFISYSSKDKRFVLRLAKDLKRRGLDIWLDLWEMKPGDRLRDKIAEGITRCNRLLVLLSPHSINSSWVKIELDSAMIRELESKRVVVVPTLYGKLSTDDIPIDLKGKHYLDFRKPSNYPANLDRILGLVERTSEDFITYHSIEWFVKLVDAKGHLARVTKQKVITPKTSDIAIIFDRDFSTPGRLKFLGASKGKLSQPIDEGGTYTVATILPANLKKGKATKHEVSFNAYDTFLKSKETLSHLVSAPYTDKVGLHVEFPRSRRCLLAKAHFYFGAGNAVEIDSARISNRGLRCDLEVKEPKVGKYVLEWEW